METRIFIYGGNFAKLNEAGNLQPITGGEATATCYTNPYTSTVVHFREGDEQAPSAVSGTGARIRKVNLNHGDSDPISPLLDRELSGCASQVIEWLVKLGAEAPVLGQYLLNTKKNRK